MTLTCGIAVALSFGAQIVQAGRALQESDSSDAEAQRLATDIQERGLRREQVHRHWQCKHGLAHNCTEFESLPTKTASETEETVEPPRNPPPPNVPSPRPPPPPPSPPSLNPPPPAPAPHPPPPCDFASSWPAGRSASASSQAQGPAHSDLRLAFVSICVDTGGHGNNFGGFSYYDQCMASLCSLLGTTSPKEVVYIIDDKFPMLARERLESMGVKLIMVDPDLAVWHASKNYPAHMFDNHPRQHTFQKLAIFNMTQYDRIFWLDSDTEVQKNLTEFFLTMPTDKDAVLGPVTGNRYFNSGVMVIRPSQDIYNELLEIWDTGDFQLNVASDRPGKLTDITEQDVLIQYFLRRHYPSSFARFDTCSNFRGYLHQMNCGPKGSEGANSEVLHLGRLVKWVDVTGWIITAW
eukprot:CAMPEP_0114225250 /NCGR_PEP_ID=MMETSP0058-20121206/558_1 /TAXON_ID=36894 /ORGANISM="Pyramimonas parkeae, CCMP726" /LENGTH=407 /DNA_ID=CAMNT_0001335815 /DNA_START=131 /DNA_END=1351 /DNA_ORIENTATION=+